jgi:hypothetical protein
MSKIELFVSDKYLIKRKEISKELLKSLSRIESNYLNHNSYYSAKKFLISLGGENPVFKRSSIYHFRPKGLGTTNRVMYSLASDLNSEVLENFKIPNETVVFLDISSESDHDKNDKIAFRLRNSQESQIYKTLVTVKSDINLETEQEIYESFYGFPIDQNQQSLLKIVPPSIIIGSAGSGKTVTAIELFKLYYLNKPGLKTVFLTLTKKLKNKVKDELDKCNFPSEKVLTFAEFSGVNYYDQDKYIQVIQESLNNLINNNFHKEFKGLLKKYPYFFNEYSLFTIIRGFIKGRLNANGSYNEYKKSEINIIMNELSKEENFKLFFKEDYDRVVKYIEIIYKDYQQKKLLNDDNDFTNEANNKYDCIIVDEVQDLTEKQISFIIKSLVKGSTLLHLYGDPNQTINPTFFSFNRVKGIITNSLSSKVTKTTLKETYRSGPNLIKYVNHISDLRKKYIGTQSDSWDEHEKSLIKRQDEKWACLVEKKESMKKLIAIFNSSDDCIIVVNGEKEKIQLKKEFQSLLSYTDLIFSVSEIKGLEHKNIIAYNILTSNSERFKEIISGKFKYSTIHRMIFNRYYVTLTRATDSIIIVENNLEENLFLKELFFNYKVDGLDSKVEEVDENLELIENFISQSKNPEAFLKSAKKFKENGYYSQSKEKALFALELCLQEKQYNYLEATLKKEIDIINTILEYNSNKTKYSDSQKQLVVEKLIVLDEFNEAERIAEDLVSRHEILSLIKYFKSSLDFLVVTKSISKNVFLLDALYKKIIENSNFEFDSLNYLKS